MGIFFRSRIINLILNTNWQLFDPIEDFFELFIMIFVEIIFEASVKYRQKRIR